jgi:catechol 2,3-dioxygenase-like lactoylglutathione lyase family enzyme
MHPQINVVTIGVGDVERAKRFYADGLGCPIAADHGVFVSFDLGGGSSLGVYARHALAAEAGIDAAGSGFSGVTFHYLVETRTAVDDALARAESAGGTVTAPAQDAQWGGYFGYFADPDGNLWKVATSA